MSDDITYSNSHIRRPLVPGPVTAVVAGALVGTAVWAILDEAMAGLTRPGRGAHASHPLGVVAVVVASLAGGLLGWVALMVVDRVLHRDRRTWLGIVSVALVLSFGGPLSGTGVTTGDRLALVLLHVSVAAVVLPLLYRSAGASTPVLAEPR